MFIVHTYVMKYKPRMGYRSPLPGEGGFEWSGRDWEVVEVGRGAVTRDKRMH